MLEIATTVLDVAKGLLGLAGSFSKTRRDRRDRAATYFSDLAALLEDVSASLKAGQYPHGSCAQLHGLATMMKDTLKGIVPEPDAQAFQDKLLGVWQIEQLFNQLQAMPDSRSREELSKLDEAAGHFRAVAAHLRVV